MKKLLALLSIALIGTLAWIAAGPDERSEVPVPRDVGAAMGAPKPASAASTSAGVPGISGEPLDTPPPEVALEPVVPIEVIAPIATVTASPPPVAVNEPLTMRDGNPEAPRPMIVPVAGVARSAMRDMFNETRGNRRHEAIDILAPTGTPVIATDDGVVKKLFTSSRAD